MSPKYQNAPIKEAVFDIKIDPVLEGNAKNIEIIHSKISDQYPIKEPFRLIQTRIEVQEGKSIHTGSEDKGVVGYRFWNKDKTQVCIFRLDGFTFSRLRPYSGWDEHFPEAMRLWNIYKNELEPDFIKRLATRYINTIEIPFNKFELTDYFLAPPQLPPGWPQDIEEFLSRIVLRFDENIKAIITQTTPVQSKPNITSIIFDNDVFAELTNYNLSSVNDEQIIDFFKRLRTLKNKIFEENLTSKAKELFK